MNKFIPTIFGTAAIVIVQSHLATAQSISSVENIAKQVTVKIESASPSGSGVIIGKSGDTYYVLTARHVVDAIVSGEEAYIITSDGKDHKLDTNKIEKLPNNLDLALVQFTSDKKYPVVTISKFNYKLYERKDYENNSISEASTRQYVFVSGWPLEVQEWVFNPGFLFDNSASATSLPDVSNPENKSGENNFGGYELIYTNLTHKGMSGGPVLDTNGRLIGIHGRGDGREIGEQDEIIRQYIDEVGEPVTIKVGLSLGIPIQTFLAWASNQSVVGYLKIENSAPPDLTEAVTEFWQPPIKINDQTNPFYWLERGNQLWRIGRVAEARGAFTKAIELGAGKGWKGLYLAWFASGFASGFDGKYDMALEACNKAIELQDSVSNYKYEAYRCKAGALQELQRYEAALESLDRALELNPNNPGDWMAQGELRYALQQYRGALESMNKAIGLRKNLNLPLSALLYNNRGLVQFELERYDLALEDIEKAISIDPNYAPAWRNKGLVLETLDRNEESLKAYDKATELDPNDYINWTNRGYVLYKMELYQEAKESFEKALKINPNYEPAKNSLKALMSEQNSLTP